LVKDCTNKKVESLKADRKYEREAKIPKILHSCGERCTIEALIMTLLSVKAFGKSGN
jgi:hypothetical protein